MKICFTVCTLNRLGQIKMLADSVLKHNPEYHFFACLADEINGRIDPGSFGNVKFVAFSDLPVDGKINLTERYDVFELSCALKPFFARYLVDKYQPEFLIYLDTDICVYGSFEPIESALSLHSIVITPHFSAPVPDDGKFPLERDVLNSGLYNGGFVAVKSGLQSSYFLTWWQERLFDQCYNNVCEGMMVDQLWLNLVPVYFPEALVYKHAGCNLAYWNLHERKLSLNDHVYLVNDLPLIFFHFSGYRIDQPERLSMHQNRIKENEHPILQSLLHDYFSGLQRNDYKKYLSFMPCYGMQKNIKKTPRVKRALIGLLKRFGYALEKVRQV